VRVEEPHFRAFPEFAGASYARRYQILCERLVARQLYGAAALVLSEPGSGRVEIGGCCGSGERRNMRGKSEEEVYGIWMKIK
jgi:hypothetical protein